MLPSELVDGFEEFTWFYHESWSPEIERWFSSNFPTAGRIVVNVTYRNDASTTAALATVLEGMAATLEDLMPNVRALQSTSAIIEAYVFRNIRAGGLRDVEESIACRLGLDRIEAARQRISDATHDFEDDVRRSRLLD